MAKPTEIVVSLGKSIPDPKAEYGSYKPMFSITLSLDEGEDLHKAFSDAQLVLNRRMEEFEADLGLPAPAPRAKETKKGVAKEGVKVVKTSLKNGVGKSGKPYTLYAIEFSNGTKVTTFDKAIAIQCSEARKKGQIVIPHLTMDGKFQSIESLEVLDEEGESEQPNDGEEEVPF